MTHQHDNSQRRMRNRENRTGFTLQQLLSLSPEPVFYLERTTTTIRTGSHLFQQYLSQNHPFENQILLNIPSSDHHGYIPETSIPQAYLATTMTLRTSLRLDILYTWQPRLRPQEQASWRFWGWDGRTVLTPRLQVFLIQVNKIKRNIEPRLTTIL